MRTAAKTRLNRPVRPLLVGVGLCGLAFGQGAFAADRSAPPPGAEQPRAGAEVAAPLSPAQMKRIENLLDDAGIDQNIPPAIAAKLALSQRVVKQLGIVDKISGDLHAYARLRDGGMLFTFVDVVKTRLAYTYRLDSNLKLAASVAMAKAGASEIADPEAGMKAELAYWAKVADQL